MKNPLQPSYRERESTPDNQLEIEYGADLHTATTDFDERLRAHEEKHDPLNEFTGNGVMLSASAHMSFKATADLTVGLSGVSATASAGTVHVINAESGSYVITPGKVSMSLEVRADMDAEAKADLDNDELHFEQPPEPVSLFDGTVRAVAWLPDAETRKLSLKRLGDENADLQDAYDEGRTGLIWWRLGCTWVWIAWLVAVKIVTPVINVIAKLPMWAWSALLWLKFW